MPQSTRQTSNVAKADVLLICDEDALSAAQKLIYTHHEEKLEAYNKAVESYKQNYGQANLGGSGADVSSQAATPSTGTKGNVVVQNGVANLQQKPLQQKPQQRVLLAPVQKTTSVPVSWQQQQQTQMIKKTVSQSSLPLVSSMIKTKANMQHLISPVNLPSQKTIIQVPAGTNLTGMQVISVPGTTGGYQLVMAPQTVSVPRIGMSVLTPNTITAVNAVQQPVSVQSVVRVSSAARLVTSSSSQMVTAVPKTNLVTTPVTLRAAEVPAGTSVSQAGSSLKRSLASDDNAGNKRLRPNSESSSEKDYYGYKKGRSWWDDEKPKGSFRCYVCNKKLSTNIRYMQHIKHHLDNEQQLNSSINNVVNCRSCYKHFNTPFQLQTHVEKAHMFCKHRCGICEQPCTDSASLILHLTKNHPTLQMPYVCGVCNYMTSFYEDLVSHFSKQHEGSKALMCPFCVRIIKCNNSFLRHCKTHLSVSMKNGLFRCRSCKLMFLNSTMLKDHTMKDHVTHTLRDRNGVPETSPFRGKQAISVAPGKNITAVPKSKTMMIKIAPSLWTRKEIIRPKGALRCIECGTMTQVTRDHFRKKMACTSCKYSTYCGIAFANHMITFHKTGSAPKVHRIRKTTVNNGRMLLGCRRCEFSTLSPTLMACHIESCPRGQTIIESFKVRTSSLQTSRNFKREVIQIERPITRNATKKPTDDQDDDDDDVIVIEDEVLVDLTDDVPSTSAGEDPVEDKTNKEEQGNELSPRSVKITSLSVKLEKLPESLISPTKVNAKSENYTVPKDNEEQSTESEMNAADAETDTLDTNQDSSTNGANDGKDQPVNGKDKVIKLKEVQIKLEQISTQ